MLFTFSPSKPIITFEPDKVEFSWEYFELSLDDVPDVWREWWLLLAEEDRAWENSSVSLCEEFGFEVFLEGLSCRCWEFIAKFFEWMSLVVLIPSTAVTLRPTECDAWFERDVTTSTGPSCWLFLLPVGPKPPEKNKIPLYTQISQCKI